MAYFVYCIYKKGSEELRQTLAEEHMMHFEKHLPLVSFGGSLKGDDSESGIGSMFVLNYESRDEVRDFLKADTYHQQDDIFESVAVHRLKVMVKDGGNREGW